MVYSSRKVEQALLNKWFVPSPNSSPDHRQLVYMLNGHKMATTKISHGADHDLDERRMAAMGRQCGLSRSQFIEFVNCTLSAEEYRQIQLARLAERLKQQPGGKTKHTKK